MASELSTNHFRAFSFNQMTFLSLFSVSQHSHVFLLSYFGLLYCVAALGRLKKFMRHFGLDTQATSSSRLQL